MRDTHTSRRDSVYAAVRRATSAALSSPHSPPVWIHAGEIAQQLQLDRANVSRELNKLYSDGQLIKVQGKPTLFLSRVDLAQKYPGIFLPSILPKDFSLSHYIAEAKDTVKGPPPPGEASELSTQVGCNGTLKTAILHAKAAVMYPPHGLHTLISGNIGTGKLLLAQNMYAHAKLAGRFAENAPFITVNCREFSGSPQAILHQLFGYGREIAAAKGEKGRRGLVDRASGGILCLIGIEKLPGIVQDNLITLLEKNTYTRVGEPAVVRQASTMIIAITSEPLDSPFMQALIQRIPVRIHIPDLSQWKLQEIAELVIQYFQKEAETTGVSFKINRDVFSTFLLNTYQGNLGSIASAVQISCSLSYLENPNPNQCEVMFRHLPEDFISQIQEDPVRDTRLQRLLDELRLTYLIFTPQSFFSDNSYREEILRILHRFDSPAITAPPAPAQTGHIPILLLFHGEGVSQGIADYVNTALSASVVQPVSYQKEEALDLLLARMKEMIFAANEGSGVLIVTDMEPIPDLNNQLLLLCGIPTATITHATLPQLLSVATLASEGKSTLQDIYDSVAAVPAPNAENPDSFFHRMVEDILAPSLSFINPYKAAQVLNRTLCSILETLDIPHENSIVIRFITHCSHMLERLIRGYPLHYDKLKSFTTQHSALISQLEQQMTYPAEVFGVTIPINELAYVAEIFLPYLPSADT